MGFNYNDKSNNSKPVHAYTNPRDRMEKKNSECLVMRFCLPLGQPTKLINPSKLRLECFYGGGKKGNTTWGTKKKKISLKKRSWREMKGREERNRHTKQQQQQQQLANQTANSKTEPNDKLGKMLQVRQRVLEFEGLTFGLADSEKD